MRALPRGRHGLSREFVVQDQRERLLASIAESLDEHGYEGATVAQITTRARVSKSDFYRHFSSKDACFLAAYDDAVDRLGAEVRAACEGEDDWAGRVLAGLETVLAFLVRDPARANLLLVEGLRAGPQVYDRFQAAVHGFVERLAKGAPEPASVTRYPSGVDEAVVGGVTSVLARRVLAGEAKDLERFLPELAEFALTPYLGTGEARRIISGR